MSIDWLGLCNEVQSAMNKMWLENAKRERADKIGAHNRIGKVMVDGPELIDQWNRMHAIMRGETKM